MPSSSQPRSATNYALVAYAATITGALFLLLGSLIAKHSPPERLESLLSEIGMVLMAVGGAHIIYDKLLREEVEDRLIGRLQSVALGNGLRLVDSERTHSAVYQRWVIESKIKEVSIIGRSVLHRMDTWATETFKQPIEKIILKKLDGGGKLTILFLDPSMPIMAQLVSEEGKANTLYRDLRTSLEICNKLAVLLQNRAGSHNHSGGLLKIAVFKKNPTFAYHKQGNQTLIGFYPLKMKGEKSPVYEAIGEDIGTPFDDHFTRLLMDGETTTLIDYDGGRKKALVVETDAINALLKVQP